MHLIGNSYESDGKNMQLASDETTPFADTGAEEFFDEEDAQEDGEEEETTLYYDAEDGTLRDADGDEVTFEMGDDEVEEEILDDNEEGEEAGGEGEGAEEGGSQTPQPAQRPQTITSTSATANTARPGLLRNLSSATQIRVSKFQPEY